MFEPRNPDYAVALRRYVEAQGYLALLGVRLGSIAPGRVEYRLPYRPDLGQQDGVFHGGVIGGMAEGVMGAAAASLVAAGANVVGAEYKLNLMAPGAGALLVAVGQVVRPGRRLIVCRADVFSLATEQATLAPAADGATLVAIAQGTMAVA
jgi:uncharacterized protein (TIGR00369 family)